MTRTLSIKRVARNDPLSEDFDLGRVLVRYGADLVVVGTRGRTGMKAVLLGTVAERIVRESPCSVLAVKPDGFKYEID